MIVATIYDNIHHTAYDMTCDHVIDLIKHIHSIKPINCDLNVAAYWNGITITRNPFTGIDDVLISCEYKC